MTIRKIHSNNVTENRADIAKEYTEIFFDDVANSILLPDPTGLLETKIGSTSAGGAATGIKGFASGYVDAGQFVTLDNLKFSVTTGGARGLCCATVSGTATLSISANYALCGGANGGATAYPGVTYNTTPSGSWFGWSFPNAGDGSTYLVNDYTNQRFYRVTLMIGAAYLKNFISIERLG
jgi:hypothetical protein